VGGFASLNPTSHLTPHTSPQIFQVDEGMGMDETIGGVDTDEDDGGGDGGDVDDHTGPEWWCPVCEVRVDPNNSNCKLCSSPFVQPAGGARGSPNYQCVYFYIFYCYLKGKCCFISNCNCSPLQMSPNTSFNPLCMHKSHAL
jgi:hypothetical protein